MKNYYMNQMKEVMWSEMFSSFAGRWKMQKLWTVNFRVISGPKQRSFYVDIQTEFI